MLEIHVQALEASGVWCFFVFFLSLQPIVLIHLEMKSEYISVVFMPREVCVWKEKVRESSGVRCMGLAGRQMGTFFILSVVYWLCKGSRFVPVCIFSWKFIWKWTHPSGEASAVMHPAAPVWSVGTEQVRRVSSRRAIMFASVPALTKLTVSLLWRDATIRVPGCCGAGCVA